MPNNYYNVTTVFIPGAKVRSDEVNAELAAVEAAFDILPTNTSAVTDGTSFLGTEAGSGNAYVVTMTNTTRTSYDEGDRVIFKATHTNTGAATLNVDGLGAISIVAADGSALAANDILSGQYYILIYSASANKFQLTSPNASAVVNSAASAAAAAASAAAAATSETNAGTSETNAAASASAASTSETNAGTSETNAAASAAAAATSETNAGTSETNAAASAAAAAISETNAGTSETNAAASAAAAALSYDSFDDRYLGEKASDPALDNDGNALLSGALYFKTGSGMMVYTGSAWITAGANLDLAYSTTKGNILIADGSNYGAKAVGDDGEALIASADQSNGAIWGTFRQNLLINGGMEIAQRGTSFAAAASGTFPVDRWKYSKSTTGVVTLTRQADTSMANGFYNYFQLDVTTADAAVAAGDFAVLSQAVEGPNIRHLGWGNSGGKSLTLRFKHKHTKTGIYCAFIYNSALDYSYVLEYQQVISDTWEEDYLTFPCPTVGTWDGANGAVGLHVGFTFMSGSTYQTTGSTWANGDYIATSNQVNGLDNTANYCRIADVVLVEGNTAKGVVKRTFSEELAACQRYYSKSYSWDVAPGTVTSFGAVRVYLGGTWTASTHWTSIPAQFPVTMAGSPTFHSYSDNTGTIDKLYDNAGATDLSCTFTNTNERGSYIQHTSSLASAATINVTAQWTADAEI